MMTPYMSPDVAFLLTLALRMAITAAFVVTASFITERSGPVIGALVATLPISAGPSYVFLAIDHDAAFIAQGALASLPINAATIFLGLTHLLRPRRCSPTADGACWGWVSPSPCFTSPRPTSAPRSGSASRSRSVWSVTSAYGGSGGCGPRGD